MSSYTASPEAMLHAAWQYECDANIHVQEYKIELVAQPQQDR